ncbi:MAG: hypothetical protein WC413_01605 [Candidatus Nanoarchaeia archaeon]
MKNKIKIIQIFCLLMLLSLPLISAGTPHINWGYVNDAVDGTLANGANVTAYIETRPTEILTDIVGVTGNSGISNAWLIDTGNFPTAWSAGNNLIIQIDKNGYKSNTNIILDNSGSQQSVNMTLSKILILVKPINKTGVNAISLLWNSQLITAQDICNDVQYSDAVTKWDPYTQMYSGHPCGTPVNNFNIEKGVAYFVSVTQNSTWVMK